MNDVSLPTLVRTAARRLESATTVAEVLDAREMAGVVYFGRDVRRFGDVFSEIGLITRRLV